MFIISWNVAGWSSTSKMIREDFGSIAAFLQRTQADIVCLQEVKGSWAKLDADPRGMGASDGGPLAVDGWESFWSFSSKAHRGFNGVATFVRKGLTWWCDSRPLRDEELNDEGRVVVTCHSPFVLVNTYVVNARRGLRLEFKMRFLAGLKELLLRLKQETGKPVILLGDLNQTYRAEDAWWSLRRLSMPAVLQLVHRAQQEEEWTQSFPWLSAAAVRHLGVFIAEQVSLIIATEAEDNHEGSGFKSISVDSAFFDCSSEGGDVVAKNNSDGEAAIVELTRRLCERTKLLKDGTGTLATLEELCEAGVRSVFVEPLMRSQPPAHNRELFALTRMCGLPPHNEESAQFFVKELLTELHLHDAFLLRRPVAGEDGDEMSAVVCPCPYTCWDQSRNKRLTNEGTRIDYILIDETLVPALVPCRRTANNVGVSAVGATSDHDYTDGDAGCMHQSYFDDYDGRSVSVGARRAMGDGAYPAAPFDGSGLPPLSVAARDVQFRGLPSTGMFVTPPQYSDHCGICAYFDGLILEPRRGKLEERHRCQYRPPVSLDAFFAKRTRDNAATTTAAIRTEAPKKEKISQARRLEVKPQEAVVVIDDNDDDCNSC